MSDDRRAATRGSPSRDRGPVARSYRKFLGRASITMFALRHHRRLLLPLLYMVTTSFQQPGQIADARARRSSRPRRRPRTYEGQPYPIYAVPMPDGDDPPADARSSRAASRACSSTRPTRPRPRSSGRAAGGRSSRPGQFAPLVDNFTTGLEPAELPAPAAEHVRDRAC